MKPSLILSILTTLFLSFVIGVAIGSTIDVNPIIPSAIIFSAGFIPMPSGSALTTPLVIRFTKDIEEKMYPNNEFYKNSVDDSQYLDGKTVRRPVSGDDPTVETNPTVFPLTLSERVDDNSDYDIDFHTTNPQFVRIDEEMQVSYAKRESILRSHVKVLNTKVADTLAYVWSPSGSASMVRTTGGNEAATAPGATGNRKAIEKKNFIDAVAILDEQDCSGDYYGLVPAKMYAQLLNITDFVDYNKTGRADMLAKGLIGEICGVKIYKRSRAGVYTNASTPVAKAPGSATATSDNQAILIWDAACVYRAEGNPNVVIGNPQPTLAGGTDFNANCFAGGKKRSDEKGVVAIIQTT